MVERIYKNATILTGKNLDIVEGYLKIRDNKIEEIGKNDPPKSGIDMGGGFILPPLINAHTHLADSVRKDLYRGKKQPEVVGEKGEKFKALRKASDEEKINSMKKELFEMRKMGIFSHCDFREKGVKGVKLLKKACDSLVKSIILARPSNEKNLENLISEADGVGLPSLDSLPDDKISKIANRVSEEDKILSFHVSETESARKNSLEEYGKTEIERAIVHDPNFLVHGTWASKNDLQELAKEKVPLVLCPRANCLLSDGIPPIQKALNFGVNIWMGTDNVSVCSPDLFQELSFAWSILRLQSDEAGSKEAKELLKAVTVNPLQYLDLPFQPIEEGNRASFIFLSRKNNLTRLDDSYVGIVNRARRDNVEGVFYESE